MLKTREGCLPRPLPVVPILPLHKGSLQLSTPENWLNPASFPPFLCFPAKAAFSSLESSLRMAQISHLAAENDPASLPYVSHMTLILKPPGDLSQHANP